MRIAAYTMWLLAGLVFAGDLAMSLRSGTRLLAATAPSRPTRRQVWTWIAVYAPGVWCALTLSIVGSWMLGVAESASNASQTLAFMPLFACANLIGAIGLLAATAWRRFGRL